VSNADIELKSETLVHGARYGLLICFYRYIVWQGQLLVKRLNTRPFEINPRAEYMAYYISLSTEIVF